MRRHTTAPPSGSAHTETIPGVGSQPHNHSSPLQRFTTIPAPFYPPPPGCAKMRPPRESLGKLPKSVQTTHLESNTWKNSTGQIAQNAFRRPVSANLLQNRTDVSSYNELTVHRAWPALAVLLCSAARGQAPAYSAAGIVNTANYAPGPFAPNSVVSI